MIIGDDFNVGEDNALVRAKQLHAAGVRLFLFRQCIRASRQNVGADIFRALAKTTNGALFEFNPAIERVAERLPHMFGAVAHYAIGGPAALRALASDSATLLLEQMRP